MSSNLNRWLQAGPVLILGIQLMLQNLPQPRGIRNVPAHVAVPSTTHFRPGPCTYKQRIGNMHTHALGQRWHRRQLAALEAPTIQLALLLTCAIILNRSRRAGKATAEHALCQGLGPHGLGAIIFSWRGVDSVDGWTSNIAMRGRWRGVRCPYCTTCQLLDAQRR